MTSTGPLRRSGWAAFVISSAARGLLATLAALAVWALVPALFGLKPTVVMTGSMEPRLVPGDVVMSRPVPASSLALGQTLLFDDPDQPGHLRMHRYVGSRDGQLITKGDANPANDSTPIDAAAVKGVATMRVPYIGSPMAWLTNHQPAKLVLLAVAALLVLAGAGYFRPDPAPAADTASDGDDDASGETGRQPGHDGADDPVRRHRVLQRAGVALSVVTVAAVGLSSAATPAFAAFSRVTANPQSNWTAATYFSCRSAAQGANATAIWALSNANGSSVAPDLSTGSPKYPGTYSSTGITYSTTGPCRSENGDGTTINGITLDGASGRVSNSAAISGPANVVQQVWFKIAAGAPGGVLASISDISGGEPGNTSFALGVTNSTNGNTLVMGVATARNQDGTIASFKRVPGKTNVKDGLWHLATAVAGANGAQVYLDGVADGTSDTTITSASAVSGTTFVGFGDASDVNLQTGQRNFFTGSVAYFSDYFYNMPAAQIAAQFPAAS